MITPVPSKPGTFFTIPEFSVFGELLHDRIHAIFYHIEELESKFMLITNLYDRDPNFLQQLREEGKDDLESLVYSGTRQQRTILERDEPLFYIQKNKGHWDRTTWQKERDHNWAALKNTRLTRDLQQVDSFEIFDAFRQGEYSVSSLTIGTLKDYFANLDNVLQENEYPIISDYFDIDRDGFIGIPLLGMGSFQGIVWVVFKAEEKERFQDQRTLRRLIKLLQVEYDNLALDWDITGVNMTRRSMVNQAISQVETENPIQKECKLEKYYNISTYYHNERIKQNDTVLDRVKEQFYKTATITILLDSYAHNISAHSLTTLSWWFRERAEYLNAEEENRISLAKLGRDQNPIIEFYKRAKKTTTLARELHPLFKFLLEKGAFWSGITRQTNFTGKISSLFSIIWFDFINNPLYLGTIAQTERVNKVKLHITIYEKEEPVGDGRFTNRKIIKRAASGQLLSGYFATINFDDFDPDTHEPQTSVFVEKDELYLLLRPELEKCKAFFPGGVIGKHSFFTLLENEIRNVKHYKGNVLTDIQDNGLTLCLSIHERPVDSSIKDAEDRLYKIGVWLGHPVLDLNAEKLLQRIEGLDAEILTEDKYQPRLGGNNQDKICASMLLNNTFDKVQDDQSNIGKIYYPWIKTASYKLPPSLIPDKDEQYIEEFEVSHRKYKGKRSQFNEAYQAYSGPGYLKKYFHLWMGAEILPLNEPINETRLGLENFGRFQFLHLLGEAEQSYTRFKSDGVIRVLKGGATPTTTAEAYRAWFPRWIKAIDGSQDIVVDLLKEGTEIGRLTYTQGKARFENYQQLYDDQEDDKKYQAYKAIPQRIRLPLEHGTDIAVHPDRFNFRSHGELISKFCQGKPIGEVEEISEPLVFELLETLATRVCIFDRRIYYRLYNADDNTDAPPSDDAHRLQMARLELYRNELGIHFKSENKKHWNSVKNKEGFLHYHFVILHLSFIEGMENAEGRTYSEEGILDFVDEQILQGKNPTEVGDDFMLVITTGRGRMAWWDKIKENKEYARFITFRPIESILSAVEDALQMPDDFDLKYNLTKLLFGS